MWAEFERASKVYCWEDFEDLTIVPVALTPGIRDAIESDMAADGRESMQEHIMMLLEMNHDARLIGGSVNDEDARWWRCLEKINQFARVWLSRVMPARN